MLMSNQDHSGVARVIAMKKNLMMFILAVLVLGILTMIVLGFMVGVTSPLPWVGIVSLGIIYILHGRFMKERYLVWKDEYSVGIESVDNDHKKLLNLINQLQTAAHYRTGEEFERQALEELVDYTKTHFRREETMLEEYDYPDLEAHKRQHAQMIAKVDEFLEQYKRNSDKAIENTLDFLKDWLIRHINGTDQEYSGYLHDKGVH
jgi:hemerythrin-like metal-binding protein